MKEREAGGWGKAVLTPVQARSQPLARTPKGSGGPPPPPQCACCHHDSSVGTRCASSQFPERSAGAARLVFHESGSKERPSAWKRRARAKTVDALREKRAHALFQRGLLSQFTERPRPRTLSVRALLSQFTKGPRPRRLPPRWPGGLACRLPGMPSLTPKSEASERAVRSKRGERSASLWGACPVEWRVGLAISLTVRVTFSRSA